VKPVRKTINNRVYFILAELEPSCHQAAQHLHYQAVAGGFAKSFPAGTPHLDRIYHNFARSAEEMVRQQAGLTPVPWDQTLGAFLRRIEGQHLDWWLGGSAALAVRGLPVVPGDLDLVVDDASAQKLGELFLDHLIEPVEPVQDWFCRWWGRAFWYARIEWVGGVDETADQPDITDFGPTAAGRLETVSWRGYNIKVPPLDLQLAVCQRRGLTERARMIEQRLREANLRAESQ